MSGGHTPGPWVAAETRYRRDFRTFVNVSSEREGFVACVSSDPMNTVTIAANALLIAAAPDMLDALESALMQLRVAVITNSDGLFTHENVHEHLGVAKIMAAIAKATGA